MILIIGSFPTNSEIFGGSTTAMGILSERLTSLSIPFITLDSTTKKIPASSLFVRLQSGLIRLSTFVRHLLNKKIETVLIFHGHGLGFLEKGVYGLMGKIAKKKVILAPRSGLILDNFKNSFYRKFASFVFSKVDTVMCQSNYWESTFLKISPKMKSEIIMNWVASNHKLPQPKRNQKTEQMHLLYTGWLEPWKGIELLIAATIKLEEESPNCIAKLDVFGEGSLRKTLQAKVNKSGLSNKIIFHGKQDKNTLALFHDDCDIFILPSTTEGMPNALLEAMSYGDCCIATNITSIPEIIEHNKTGYLINPEEVTQLKNAISTLAKLPVLRHQMGINAQEYVYRNHNPVTQINKLLALCNIQTV